MENYQARRQNGAELRRNCESGDYSLREYQARASEAGGARARHVAMVRDQATCMRPMAASPPRRSRRAVVSPTGRAPAARRLLAQRLSAGRAAARLTSGPAAEPARPRTPATRTRHSLVFTNIINNKSNFL